ncbi:MAG: class I SAM-dependent methyltransferase [Spirochaetaceae bacterium]|nr:class I SAM-dependent methyltransferase [Spirochaetaceae bacterium]
MVLHSQITEQRRKETEDVIFENIYTKFDFERPLSCTSQICNQEFFGLPFYQYWTARLKEKPWFHRKQWEFVYIAQTLFENNMLTAGSRGLGFGVGVEPLPALFASMECKITASDMDTDSDAAKKWESSKQHSGNKIELLNQKGICPPDVFAANVSFRNIDMNKIPDDLRGAGQFDFIWSSCALEHIGGPQKSADFIFNSLDTLRPGGLAVHTTEYNLSSDEDTHEDPYGYVFRKKDIEGIVEKIYRLGHYVYPLDFRQGIQPADTFVDEFPYKQELHLRLRLEHYAATSLGIIIRKGIKCRPAAE